MKITKEQIKETLKLVMNEEADYKVFFKKALEKAGKSIPSMSDDEKKAFFNKIDAAWDAKSEVKEGNAFGAAVVAAKEAGEDEFEVDGEKFKVEESHSDCGCGCGGVTEGGCNTKSVNEANTRDEYDAQEFWGVSKLGIQLHKQFKGRFNKSKFEKALSDLMRKSKRLESTIKIIGRYLNIKPSKLNSYTSGEFIEDQEFIKDSTKKAEQLYKIFVSSNESVVNEATDIYQLKKIQITKFAGKGEQMIQINAPKYQTAGDHLVMTTKEFMHVLKMAPLLLKQLKESVVNEASDFAGWIAIDHKGNKLEIKKSEAKDLYNAKLLAIKKLKVPKSKESMLAIKPAYNESVNEASKEAMGIAALTGTRGSAVEDFILKHELDGKKLFKSITKANLRGRLNFVSALAGKDGNPNQKLTIKLHKENFNEELSTELAFEVITFMERPVMETVMVDEFEKSDIVEMLVNEGINDVLTEGVKAEFNTLVETYNKK